MVGGRPVLDRSLKDRVVVVTGASRGIGREIAVRAAVDRARDDSSGYRLAARDEDLTPGFYLSTTPLPTL
jgi:NAD(P)-dependent dehydrogenase (short-subunit alcohol dehydrogenase family)